MSVDYDAVGGIGIKVSNEMIEKFIKSGLFTEEDFSDDEYGCLEGVGIPYNIAGDGAYSGEPNIFYFMVKGETLTEIIKNEKKFRDELGKYGINLNQEDLVVIEDLHIC